MRHPPRLLPAALRRGPDAAARATAMRRLAQVRDEIAPVAHGAASAGAGWIPTPDAEWLATSHDEPQSGDLPEAFDGRAPRGTPALLDEAVLQQSALNPGRRGFVVLAVLALVAALIGVWYFVAAAPAAGSTEPSRTESQPASGSTVPNSAGAVVGASAPPAFPAALAVTPTPTPVSELLVDVVGKVAQPGVVTLPAQSRIRDAVAAAGGALPDTDLTALDLASHVVDGEEIFVGIPPPSGPSASAGGGVVGGTVGGSAPNAVAAGGAAAGGGDAGNSAGEPVDLNTADATQLQTLPGIGAVLAGRILAWRSAHGQFSAVSQLEQVPGIGPSKFQALIGLVHV